MFRLRTSLDRRRVLSERRLPASRNNHVAHCEVLEDRRMLTLVWANRGDASDMFDDAFGDNAEVARGVVDSALNEWNRVVVGYDGGDFETQMTIAMNPSNPATSAAASGTVRDANGVPISGNVTINMALDNLGNTQWYLDPTPDDHSEFMGTLQHAFARNPTPGGPADGMRDLRTLLVHELGHTMGVSSGSPLIYNNPNITVTNTGITDNTVGSGGNSYWLFQGPSTNVVMTDFDINAGVTTFAGHNAMPITGNVPINFNGQSYFTAIDTMQPTSLSIRRILLSDKVAGMMSDMGYDVVLPETFGTFHSVLNQSTGLLTIQGGNDNTLINNVNQGASSDTVTLLRFGGFVFVGVDIGIDVPGSGRGTTPNDQQDAFISRFRVEDLSQIRIEGFDGDDVFNFIGNFDFLSSLLVIAGDGEDTVDGGGLTGTQPLLAFGGDDDDTLIGGPGNDTLSGLGGNDTIRGFAGNDFLLGGTGNDSMSGGLGNDTIFGESGNDSLQGNGGNDTISGGSGNDFILGGSFVQQFLQNIPDGADTIQGGGGNDYILGDNALGATPTPLGGAGDTIQGGDDNDAIWGGIGNDRLYGEDGNDTLVGYSGDDLLDGGAGSDSLSGEAGDDDLVGGLGSDNLFGGIGNDFLVGGLWLANFSDSSADTLRGGDGDDTLIGDNFGLGPEVGGNDNLDGEDGDDALFGQIGNDTLVGGLGSDELSGGDGNDTLVGGTILGVLDASGDELNGGRGNDLLIGDNVGFGVGVGGNDVLRGDEDDDRLYGQYGNDVLQGGSGNDTLVGYLGNDSLDGGSGDDELDGGAGNDTLIGGLGVDTLAGGADNDTLIGGTLFANALDASGDDLDGGAGNDTLIGDNLGFGPGIGGPDTLRGGTGNDQIYGQYDNDSLEGDAGDDNLFGGDGDDSLAGGSGDDTLLGQAGNDVLAGGEDDDMLSGAQGDDTLDGGDGNDELYGGADNDLLRGGNDDDELYGEAGNDILLGEDGRDVIFGGLGRDILIGGLGIDRMAGGDEQDILIAGLTRHDFNDAALYSIRDEWTSRRSYEERVANLRGEDNPTFADRLNGDNFLRKGIEVADDAGENVLSGEEERDWFFAQVSDVLDIEPGEELN